MAFVTSYCGKPSDERCVVFEAGRCAPLVRHVIDVMCVFFFGCWKESVVFGEGVLDSDGEKWWWFWFGSGEVVVEGGGWRMVFGGEKRLE